MNEENSTNNTDTNNGAGNIGPAGSGGTSWKTLLVLSFIAALAGLVYCTTTPEFTVVAARYAIEHKSIDTFEKAVDVDKVTHNLVVDMVSSPVASVVGGGNVGNWITRNISDLLQKSLEPVIKNEIRDAVQNGSLAISKPADAVGNASQGNTPSGDATQASDKTNLGVVSEQLGFSDYRYTGMEYFHREAIGYNKILTLNFHSDKDSHDIAVKVELEKADGAWFWRVVRISNFTEISNELISRKADQFKRGIGLGQ